MFCISNGIHCYGGGGEALEADLAGLGGIDDVEDMLDDEGFLQLLRQQEVSIPPTFVTLDNFLYDSWLSCYLCC